MSTATLHATATLRSNLKDVATAARRFAKALFAAQERKFLPLQAPARPAAMTDRERVKHHVKLIAMANRYQDMQPSLAAELRQLASRG